jgi:hypothetical protein
MTNLGANPSQMKACGPWRPTTPGDGPGVKHANQWLVEMPDGTLGAGASVQSGSLYSLPGQSWSQARRVSTDATPSGPSVPNLTFPYACVQYKNLYGHLTIDGMLQPGQPMWALRRDGPTSSTMSIHPSVIRNPRLN